MTSLDRIKKQLNIDAQDTGNDDELKGVLAAVLAPGGPLEQHTGEVFEPDVFVERVVPSHRDGLLRLRRKPVIDVTSVTSLDGETSYDVSDVVIDARLGTVELASLPARGVVVTYEAGWETLPANYAEAAEIIVQNLWETQRGQLGSPEFGAGATVMSGMPNRALELLGGRQPLVG